MAKPTKGNPGDALLYRGSQVRTMLREKDQLIHQQQQVIESLAARFTATANAAANTHGVLVQLVADLGQHVAMRFPSKEPLNIEHATSEPETAPIETGDAPAAVASAHTAERDAPETVEMQVHERRRELATDAAAET